MPPAYLSAGSVAARPIAGGLPGDPIPVIVVGMGESGMVGQGGQGLDAGASLPVGYPPAAGKVRALNSAWEYDDPIVEPIEAQGAGAPVFVSMVGEAIIHWGWGGVFSWRLQQSIGDGYEVIYLPCARGARERVFWSGGYIGSNSGVNDGLAATIHWVREAYKFAQNAVVGAFLLDQGINDYLTSSETGWSTTWQGFIATLRTQLDGTTAPVLCAKQFATKPVPGGASNWTNLLAEYDAFASAVVPKRIVVQKEDGPWVESDRIHVAQSANNALADDMLAAALTDVQAAIAAGRPSPLAGGVLRGWGSMGKTLATDCVIVNTRTKMVAAEGGPDLSASSGRAIYFLFRVNTQSVGSTFRIFLGRGQTGSPGSGVLVQLLGTQNQLRFRVVDGSNAVRNKDYTITVGDVGKVLAVVCWHDGTQTQIRVNKADAAGGPTACVGFTPSGSGVAGFVGDTTWSSGNTDVDLFGLGSCDLPSDMQMDEWADACKAAMRCVEMPGVTNHHLYNFATQGEVVEDEIGTDNLVANKLGKVRLSEASPTWGY